METAHKKLKKLKQTLLEMNEVVVAYSGGVDSAFLLKTAYDVLGDRTFGVLAISPTYPSREYEKAIELAKKIGVKLETIHTNELEDDKFKTNPVNRCYFCKSELFTKVSEILIKKNYKNMVDGSNFDDKSDHRPGMQALKELNVRSPLQEAGLTKQEIRRLSKEIGLPTWNKDALACLSSRFPYGETISIEKLEMVDKAEDFLLDLGFNNIRARHQGKTLKIEVNPSQIKHFFDDKTRAKVITGIKQIGYTYVTIDLEGYRQGSMNEVLSKSKIDSVSI